jgi:hypothetical protein
MVKDALIVELPAHAEYMILYQMIDANYLPGTVFWDFVFVTSNTPDGLTVFVLIVLVHNKFPGKFVIFLRHRGLLAKKDGWYYHPSKLPSKEV